jgi:N-carbamoyl-L-amino-acid hydrolase
VQGAANHAGTTAMRDRQDALVAASELIIAVNDLATRMPGAQVGTVGALEVHPNATNVVPGRVNLSIELRDMKAETLHRLTDEIEGRAGRIARERRVTIDLQRGALRDGVPCHPAVMALFEQAAQARGWRTRRLPSGAGHDASNFAGICPLGMVFVPSIGGISHAPRELTSWEDCARGAQLLLDAVLASANDAE